MPLDYSKTYIYKLCCRDVSITEIYVGSTTNFAQRKRAHRSDCANESRKHYNAHVYTFIRDHGGWENWDMVLVDTVSVSSKLEAHKIERGYIESLRALLNTQMPARRLSEYKKEYRLTRKEEKRAYVEANKGRIKEYMAEYRASHKEGFRKYKREYRARKKLGKDNAPK